MRQQGYDTFSIKVVQSPLIEYWEATQTWLLPGMHRSTNVCHRATCLQRIGLYIRPLLRKINFFHYARVFFGKAGFCQGIDMVLQGKAPKSDVVHLTLYRKMGYNQVRDIIGDRGASILRSVCKDDDGNV